MEKNKTAKTVGLFTAVMVASGSVFAEGGVAGAATTAISGSNTDLTTVGGAVIAAVAGIWVIKRIISLIR